MWALSPAGEIRSTSTTQPSPRWHGIRTGSSSRRAPLTAWAGNIWNARDGTLLCHLLENDNARLALSPDGATLATATAGELVLWNTAAWQPRWRTKTGAVDAVPVPAAFSPDGTLLAVALTRQEIQLLDPHTGNPLATLTAPLPLNLVTLRFSADGRHLAAQTLGPVIHLWDLHALRRELRALGLDWW